MCGGVNSERNVPPTFITNITLSDVNLGGIDRPVDVHHEQTLGASPAEIHTDGHPVLID
jgi:hypothetical protein